ncbi:MAG: antibiotic biosynthesis monooxygenase [Planctomycetota bacterium]
MEFFAATPEPPYLAVLFSSVLTDDPMDYGEVAARMLELASQQDGFLGAESVRDDQDRGITISYWRDEAAIAGWRADVEHRATMERAADFYAGWRIRVARVERALAWDGEPGTPA